MPLIIKRKRFFESSFLYLSKYNLPIPNHFLSSFQEKTNAMKALRREQYEAAAQLQRQQTLHHSQHHPHGQPIQQQPQLQNHHQSSSSSHPHATSSQQPRSLPLSYGAASRLASSGADHLSSSGGLTRGGLAASVGPQQLHNHRHVSMSPPLLLSSSNGLLHHHHNHNHALNASQRGVLGPVSPPATPGDRSPTSPAHGGLKHLNRSQQQQQQQQQQQMSSREAATGSVSPGLPAATLDLSSAANTNSPHELSTLV